jgi:hypothetical protein
MHLTCILLWAQSAVYVLCTTQHCSCKPLQLVLTTHSYAGTPTIHCYIIDQQQRAPKAKPQTLFLRAISHRAETYSPEGADKSLLMALDELERAMLDPR